VWGGGGGAASVVEDCAVLITYEQKELTYPQLFLLDNPKT
jgi:hypothetical protein